MDGASNSRYYPSILQDQKHCDCHTSSNSGCSYQKDLVNETNEYEPI